MNDWTTILAAETIERRLEFARVPSGWVSIASIAILLVLLGSVVFFYRYEQRSGASLRVRGLLAGLRCLVLLLLVMIWLEPVLAMYLHRSSEAYTMILADSSASMGLPDRYGDPAEAARIRKIVESAGPNAAAKPDRWSLLRGLLGRKDAELLRGLAARNSVRVMRFGTTTSPLGQIEVMQADEAGKRSSAAGRPGDTAGPGSDAIAQIAKNLAAARADMPATDLSRAVRQAVESAGGNPVAAIVVLSDGRFNQGEQVEVIAQYARDKRIPIFTVGIGDPAPPHNVAVAAVEAPPNVFVQDPFRITAHLRTEGMDGESLQVELLERGAGDETPRTIDKQQVQVPTGGQVPPVVFSHKIGEAQEDRLTIRVAPHEDEILVEDNSKEVTVRALANKMRVLLVAGGPSWEYRYLSRLLERDVTADVSCWLQSADEQSVREGKTVIDHFPRESGELAQYDCIVLLDPQPGDVNTAWTGEVEKMISDRGCGLLYVAGRQNTPRLAHDPDSKAMLDLLPVVFDAGEADLVLNELGHFQRSEWPVAIPSAAAGSPVLAISDRPDENAEIWSRLGGVFWHYPVRREKPVATVLLRHSNPAMHNAYGNHILLASQFVGSGRTGFLAFDSTWRWRRYGEKYFNRFWIQLLRHMVEGKLLSGQRRGFIQVEHDETSIGEPAAVEARLLDLNYQPLVRPDVTAAITVDGAPAGTMTLQAQPNRPGWFRGQFVPTRIGTHTLRIDLPSEGETSTVSIRGELRVGRPDLEFRNTSLNRDSLELLASHSAGGKYLNIDEVDQLPSLIPSKVMTLVLTGQPTTLWDRWWVMAALVSLLAVEWFVRKRKHLL